MLDGRRCFVTGHSICHRAPAWVTSMHSDREIQISRRTARFHYLVDEMFVEFPSAQVHPEITQFFYPPTKEKERKKNEKNVLLSFLSFATMIPSIPSCPTVSSFAVSIMKLPRAQRLNTMKLLRSIAAMVGHSKYSYPVRSSGIVCVARRHGAPTRRVLLVRLTILL